MNKASEAQLKKRKNIITLSVVGASVIGIAVLLVLWTALAPGISAKNSFKKQLDKLETEALQHVTLYDPVEKEDMFAMNGVERVVSDEKKNEFKRLFLEASDGASFFEIGQDLSFSDFDYRLRFRLQNGETYDFYLKDGRIYVVEGSSRSYFTPKNMDAYSELIELSLTVIPKSDK